MKQLLVVGAVIAISMVFIIQFRPGTNVDVEGGPTCAVEVSGECIPHSDFVTAFRLAGSNVDEQLLEKLRLRRRIAQGLVERHLLVKEAERLGLSVSDEEVSEFIATNFLARFSLPAGALELVPWRLAQATKGLIMGPPAGPARNISYAIVEPESKGFDYERYQSWVVRATGKTEKDFKTYQKKEALAARMRQLIKSRVHVSEREAFARYSANNEKVVVDYAKLDRGYYQDYALDASDEAVSAWAEEHADEVDESWASRKESFTPTCREARHILVRLDETNPDEEAALAEARETIAAAQKRIEGGAGFAEVAREVSMDSATADDGGSLGCFAEGKLAVSATTAAIDEAVYALDPGAVSEPIETKHGVHLVKVDAVLEGEAAEEHGRGVVARELYLKKEAERLASEGAKKILAAVRDGKPLEKALHDHLTSVLSEEAEEDYLSGRAQARNDEEGDAPGPEPAEETSGEDEPLNAWTDPARPQLKTSDPFPRGGPPFSRVEDPMVAANQLFELGEPGAVPDDVIKLYDGYAVAQLEERKTVSEEEWQEEREDYMEQYLRAKRRDALIYYVERLREKHVDKLVWYIDVGGAAKAEGGEG